MTQPLPLESLCWKVPEGALDFETTADVEPSDAIVGQGVALAAFEQGVRMHSPGYNIFVVGLESGGRLRTVQRILQDLAPGRRKRRDFVYVRNLTDVSRPCMLTLPAGKGTSFQRELLALGDALFEEIPRILDGEAVRKSRDRLVRDLERAQRESLLGLQDRVRAEGFMVGEDGEGDGFQPLILYIVEEQPRTRAEIHLMAHEGELERPIEELEARFDALEDELANTLIAARLQVLATSREVRAVEETAVRGGIEPLFTELGSRFPAARPWLTEVMEAVAESVDLFREVDDDEGSGPDTSPLLLTFHARVLHVGARSRTAPIVVVADPTFGNLFGGIAHDGMQGRSADHTDLRAGALHDADGGFLVANAADLLMEPGAWKTLKRAMLFGKLGIQNLEGATQGAAAPLRPEAVPLDVKVVLLGDMYLFSMLYDSDPDFASIFKIKAEFEEVGDFTDDIPRAVAGFLARMGAREGFRPLHRDAVATIVKWAVRNADRGGRIRLAFRELTDLAREADYVAKDKVISRSDVEEALARRTERHGLFERRQRDSLLRDLVHVATDGRVRGQVNGLAVYQSGGHDWGRPLRITATVGSGRGGFVNIEREAGLSGRVYDKGLQVLAGFVRGRFGRERTLALTASICMEQHYGRIDGDSASSAEVYALLSAISGVPIDQGRAVTGSVDQLGNVQPIGGVNEKIEGFHHLCEARGLSGRQGVIIPRRNVDDLCLSNEVVASCAEARFHVWAIDTIEEGLALLTDQPVGDAAGDSWPVGTIYGKVVEELTRFEKVLRRATRGLPKKEGEQAT